MAADAKPPATTEHGHSISEAVSAYQKLLRRSDFEGALYFGLLVFRKAPQYIWRRTLIAAAEDIGLADVETVMRVGQLFEMWRGASQGSWATSAHHLTLAIFLLAAAPKDSRVEDAQTLMLEQIKDGAVRPIPDFALDAHTKAGKIAGRSWADWYADRLRAGMPRNPFLDALWKLRPAWRPPEVPDPDVYPRFSS